ncbi:MAG: exosortase family protein XrtF [Cyclobacteriaceae bacterium]|nr:exosortase family protein XrtF [Cyclobacteriaceae bacterium]
MKEFIPAFRFLGVFLGLYFGLNLAYGLWISSYGSSVDWATRVVTEQTSFIINLFGENTATLPKPASPTVSIMKESQSVISVFEGCNGINVMIVFVSFLIAFKGSRKQLAWFLPLGIVIIYVSNLLRVAALYYVAFYWQRYFYYVHKYAFTATIYLIVFALWVWWMERVSGFSLKKLMTSK